MLKSIELRLNMSLVEGLVDLENFYDFSGEDFTDLLSVKGKSKGDRFL